MPSIIGNLIVLAVVIAIVAFAIRSMIKKHKAGGCCGCDCGCGGGCSCGCGEEETSK